MSGFGWSTGTGGYDAEDRLVAWDRSDGNLSHDWTLSAVGDWDSLATNGVAQSRTQGPAHEVTAVATQPVTHDAKGNITADDQGRTYVWDADNLLASITVAAGSPVGIEGTHGYAYDALGRRVSKSTSGTTTVFVSLTVSVPPLGTVGGQILAEYNAGTVAGSPQRNYAYGGYVDEPLALIDAASGGVHYYHQKGRYDVVALSDAAGAVAERYAYDAYGNTLIYDGGGTNPLATSALGNRFAFTGRERDAESGLYYFRARYYDTQLGRFVGRDPIGYADGLSLYAYVASNPIRYTDPLGNDIFGNDPGPDISKLFKDPNVRKDSAGCVRMQLFDFLKWYK